MTTDIPEHLRAQQTNDRGFVRYPTLVGRHQTQARIFESSLAEGPHLWVEVKEPEDLNTAAIAEARGHTFEGPWKEATLNCPTELAWQLADQLRHATVNHYQGTPWEEGEEPADVFPADGAAEALEQDRAVASGVDWRALFERYVDAVAEAEGVTFLQFMAVSAPEAEALRVLLGDEWDK